MSFWETVNNCLVLCDVPDNFEQLFDVFEYHRLNFIDRYRLILWILGASTNLIVFSTIIFIFHVKSAVDRSYRNVVLMNIILPCLFTNYMCFIWQPYVIAPYFMFFVVGPIIVDYFVTGICMIIWVNLLIPFVYSLISQLNYHFFIVVYPSKILKMRRFVIFWNLATILSVVFNVIVIYLAISDNSEAYEKILKIDIRLKDHLSNFGTYVIDMKNANYAINLLIFEGIYAIILTSCALLFATYKLIKSFKNQELQLLSLSKQKKRIVLVLLIYVITYLLILAIPSIIFSGLFFTNAKIEYYPIAALFFILQSSPAILFCLINLLTITPFREKLFSKCLSRARNAVDSVGSSTT